MRSPWVRVVRCQKRKAEGDVRLRGWSGPPRVASSHQRLGQCLPWSAAAAGDLGWRRPLWTKGVLAGLPALLLLKGKPGLLSLGCSNQIPPSRRLQEWEAAGSQSPRTSLPARVAAGSPAFGQQCPLTRGLPGPRPVAEALWWGCGSRRCGHQAVAFFPVKVLRVVSAGSRLVPRSVLGARRSFPRVKLLEALSLLTQLDESCPCPGASGGGAGQEAHGVRRRRGSPPGQGAPRSGRAGPALPAASLLGLLPACLPPQALSPSLLLLLSPTPFLEVKSSRKIIKK